MVGVSPLGKTCISLFAKAAIADAEHFADCDVKDCERCEGIKVVW